ncbi:hypothetical protein GQ457_05G003450 [Hibiscus cannabinus]
MLWETTDFWSLFPVSDSDLDFKQDSGLGISGKGSELESELDFLEIAKKVKVLKKTGTVKSMWLICVSGAVWSLWLARNDKVFRDTSTTIKNLLLATKMLALFWCKASRDVFLNDENWWENPLLCFTSDCNIPYWSPPSLGEMKFNVDGAVSVGSAGCGGVLRTSEGEVRAMFSALVPIFEADFAEVYAIKTALAIFIEASWNVKTNLLVETDSQLAISWIRNVLSRSWRWWNIFEEIDGMFADDLLLFCDDSLSQLKNVIRILRGFEIASGLKLNLEKSRLLGINVENDTVVRWASLLHCQSDNFPCQYLGLPLGAAKNSTQLWQPVVEIFKKKLTGWKSKMLSFGGRITLVKSVLSSLPVYYSSIFPMPSSISSLLAQLTARFLWGSIDSKAIHWVSWESMCLPKACGGLGLCDFKLKNRALLNKWLWRFGVEQDSLWRKVIACKYEGNNSSILPLNLSTRNKSWIWRRIISPLSNAGEMKFNVDGAVSVGSAGCGGVLRTSVGEVWAMEVVEYF